MRGVQPLHPTGILPIPSLSPSPSLFLPVPPLLAIVPRRTPSVCPSLSPCPQVCGNTGKGRSIDQWGAVEGGARGEVHPATAHTEVHPYAVMIDTSSEGRLQLPQRKKHSQKEDVKVVEQREEEEVGECGT